MTYELRERLDRLGPSALADAELLGLVLGMEQAPAGEVLRRLGGVAALPRLGPAEGKAAGLTARQTRLLRAAGELAGRVGAAPLHRGEPLHAAERVFAAYGPRLRPLAYECFLAVALDAKHRVLAEREIARGHLTGVEVHPRELYGWAARESACAVLVAHNHPSGSSEPSREDITLTHRLHAAGVLMCIELLDHVVLGDQQFTSFRSSGLMP